jgi:Tfp pilus assembly protein PilF
MLPVVLALSYSTANAASYWVDDASLFEHAVSIAPENAMARNNYAVQLFTSGDYGRGLPILQKLVNDRPDFYLGNYNLGRVLYEMNLLAPAEDYLKRATRLNPALPYGYLQLGLVYMKAGHLDWAEHNFRQALFLRPDDPKFHFALGVTLAARSDCPQARSEFSQALLLDPKLTRAQDQMEKCGNRAASAGAGAPALPAPAAPVAPARAVALPSPLPTAGPARTKLAPVKGP